MLGRQHLRDGAQSIPVLLLVPVVQVQRQVAVRDLQLPVHGCSQGDGQSKQQTNKSFMIRHICCHHGRNHVILQNSAHARGQHPNKIASKYLLMKCTQQHNLLYSHRIIRTLDHQKYSARTHSCAPFKMLVRCIMQLSAGKKIASCQKENERAAKQLLL